MYLIHRSTLLEKQQNLYFESQKEQEKAVQAFMLSLSLIYIKQHLLAMLHLYNKIKLVSPASGRTLTLSPSPLKEWPLCAS